MFFLQMSPVIAAAGIQHPKSGEYFTLVVKLWNGEEI